MRFEPFLYQGEGIISGGISRAAGGYANAPTIRMIYATSWGKFQILGRNLYAQGYLKTLAEFLNSEDDQLREFEIFIKARGFENVEYSTMTYNKADFARVYNGPGDVSDYVNKMDKVGLIK